jgi:hypothetical protein
VDEENYFKEAGGVMSRGDKIEVRAAMNEDIFTVGTFYVLFADAGYVLTQRVGDWVRLEPYEKPTVITIEDVMDVILQFPKDDPKYWTTRGMPDGRMVRHLLGLAPGQQYDNSLTESAWSAIQSREELEGAA